MPRGLNIYDELRLQRRVDPDAEAYLSAVERAENQSIESGVKVAVNEFVSGCKIDGIWNAIKACCILAGARTLTGALVPLVGTAPTNINFVAADYNRKTGLLGDGSTKHLNSNRNNNSDPQDSKHIAVFQSTHHSRNATRGAIGNSTFLGGSQLLTTTTQRTFRVNIGTALSDDILVTEGTAQAGMWAASRSSSTSIDGRYAGVSNTYTVLSSSLVSENIDVFRRGANFSNGRITFYSIGESLNLALLDARVTALMEHIGREIA